MLPTTAAFDAAADANTLEAKARVRIFREFNAIVDTITVSAQHDPIEERYDETAVVSIRNPKYSGIAFGPVKDAFTSSNPRQSFRAVLGRDFNKEEDIRYYIPVASGASLLGNVTVNYGSNYDMNQIEFRYENSRTGTTSYDSTINIYTNVLGGSETLAWTGAMNSDGVTTINYTGSAWSSSAPISDSTTPVRTIRVEVTQTSEAWQPRYMYIGGIHALDVSDDVVSVSVTKSSFEKSALSPIGQPSANTCSIELDNTASEYRFGVGLDRNFFLKHQRITVEFGINTKYGGGADAFEYVPGGTFYIDGFNYSESNMSVSIDGRDFSQVLQERNCGNFLWTNKSLKYIVYDVLARSGISPKHVRFDFGVAGNANETNLRKFTWSTKDQTVWDFLSELAKSELGTVFVDEEENLVFTDRLDIDTQYTAGSQYSIVEHKNLESVEETFNIVANKVKVKYEELAVNSTKFNPELVSTAEGTLSYKNGSEQLLNQRLWTPDGDEGYLGSAILWRELNPTDTHVYITPKSAVQITRKEGEILIGDEFITYKNRVVRNDGGLELEIVKRNSRHTARDKNKTHLAVNSNYHMNGTETMWARSIPHTVTPAARRVNEGGVQIALHTGRESYNRAINPVTFGHTGNDSASKYRAYGCRIRFDDTGYNRFTGAKYRQDDAGGMFIGLNGQGYGIFLEISNPNLNNSLVYPGVQGNVRAYKASKYLTVVPLPPALNGGEVNYGQDVRFETGVGDKRGSSIDFLVIQKPVTRYADILQWYINGNFIGEFRCGYGVSTLRDLGYNANQQTVGAADNDRGRFGVFTRGGTSMTVEYIYATNDPEFGPDELDNSRGVYRGFNKVDNTLADMSYFKQLGRLDYYYEFASPVHEVQEYKVDHDSYPNLYARTMNTNEGAVTVFKDSHSPFNSHILVANTSRIGTQLNDTLYLEDGTTRNNLFFVYGVGVVKKDTQEIETSDGPSIRRYGVEEVEFTNPWVNSRPQAISLASFIRKFWKQGQQQFVAEIFPNPALQPRDRVSLSYPSKGLTGGDVWFITGITITYDGGLSCTLDLTRFEDYPTKDVDYRDSGGVNIG